MKLHTLHVELPVAHPHDLTVLGLGRHFQASRQARPEYRQRVIAGRKEGAGKSLEHSGTRVTDRRGLAVHDPSRMADQASEGLADRLMAEAHAQNRYLAGKLAYRGERNAR